MSRTKQLTKEQTELFHRAYKDLNFAWESLNELEEEYGRVWFLRVQIQNIITILNEMDTDNELDFWRDPNSGTKNIKAPQAPITGGSDE